MNPPERKTLDQIIKLFFDKSQDRRTQASKDLDTYLKQKVNPRDQTHSLKDISTSIKKLLFDPSAPYRQLISKGDMSIFFPIFHSFRSFPHPDPSIFFTLIEPLLSFFKEQEPKLIVICASTLIKLLKNLNKVVLTYFTYLFECLVLLKENPDQDVRNCGNALDEFLKDSLGSSYQGLISNKKQSGCDFSIDFLLLKLNESTHPSVKVLVVSWITYIESIHELNLVSYLTKIIPMLLKLVKDNTSDVYQCGEQCLKKICNEIDIRYEELSETYPGVIKEIAEVVIKQCKEQDVKVRICSFEWLVMLLSKYRNIIAMYVCEKDSRGVQESKMSAKNKNILIKVGLLDKDENSKQIYASNLIKNIPFRSFPNILDVLVENAKQSYNKQIVFLLDKCNVLFKKIILSVPNEIIGPNIKMIEMKIKEHLDYNNTYIKETDKEKAVLLLLDWSYDLFERFHCQMFTNAHDFIEKLTSLLPESNEIVFNNIMKILCKIPIYNKSYSNIIIKCFIDKLSKNRNLIKPHGISIYKQLSKSINVMSLLEITCDYLLKNSDVNFVMAMISVIDNFIATENESEYIRMKLKKSNLYRSDINTDDEQQLFDKLFTLFSFNPISTLFLCIVTEYFELSFFVAEQLSKMKLMQEDYEQLENVVQLLEDLQYVDMRLKLLEPFKNILYVKTLYAIAMLLPDDSAYNSLCCRLRCIKVYLKLDEGKEVEVKGRKVGVRDVINPKGKWDVVSGEEKERVEKYVCILNDRQKMKTNISTSFT